MPGERTNAANNVELEQSEDLDAAAPGGLTSVFASTAAAPAVPFYAVIDYANADKIEFVRVTGKTATTLTFSSIAERYLEGSAAPGGITHLAGAKWLLAPTAQNLDDLWDAIEALQADVATAQAAADAAQADADQAIADAAAAQSTANAAIPKSLVDAAGDMLYGSADNTVARLPLGSASQVLRVNAGATAPEWASPTALSTEHTAPTELQFQSSTAENTIFSHSVPGGRMGANGGGVELILGFIVNNTSGSTCNFTPRIKFGATTVLGGSSLQVPNSWIFYCLLRVLLQNRDSASSQIMTAWLDVAPANFQPGISTAGSADYGGALGHGTATENSALAKTLAVTMTMDVNSPNAWVRRQSGLLIAIPARG